MAHRVAGETREISQRIVKCFESGGKLLLCGNGGSATQASHFAAEMISQFEKKRDPLPAIALTVDPAVITAIANDYGYEKVFARQLQALCGSQDMVIVLSTSGKSQNCLEAIEWCKENNVSYIDWPRARGKNTAAIQEYQVELMHKVCRMVEKHYT